MAAATAALMVLSACGSGYHYVTRAHPRLIYKSGANGGIELAAVKAGSTFFKLPPGWRVLREDDFLNESGALTGASPEGAALVRAKRRVQVFDAATRPNVQHLLSLEADDPTGLAEIKVLDDDERDGVSLAGLRNFPFQIDRDPTATNGNNDTEVLLQDDTIVRPGGFHGSRVIFNLRSNSGKLMTFDKTALVDKNTRVLYLFLVGCEAQCFRDKQKTIGQVVDSWTIKER